MGRSLLAAVFVLCGALLGCLGYGAVFGVVSSSMLEPSFQRGLLFGMTFGAAAGALIALASVDAESGRRFAAKLLPRLIGLVIVAVAVRTLFWQGGWDAIFEGSNGLALASTILWAGTAAWLTKEIAT